jgi:gliding motility-associated-like protein
MCSLPADTAVDFCTVNALSLAVEALPADAVIVWSTGSSTPSIPVGAAGSYSVHVSAPGYCAASATIDVTDLCITPVYAPNAFTPNGDGFNDAWQPVWRANANAEVEFTVFDRWGGVVYHAATRDATWDGTVNGTPVPAGVYAWTGHAWDPVTKARSAPRGHVLLLR